MNLWSATPVVKMWFSLDTTTTLLRLGKEQVDYGWGLIVVMVKKNNIGSLDV